MAAVLCAVCGSYGGRVVRQSPGSVAALVPRPLVDAWPCATCCSRFPAMGSKRTVRLDESPW